MKDHRDTRYAWFVAGLLAVAYAVAFVDRQVLNLLVDPIKTDLGLSDTRISLLQGFAFVFAYVAMGPVFGRLADRGNRRNLLIAGIALWSGFTVLCGFSQGFWSLFTARAGIGAAEACLLPAAWSMLADYFSREKLPRAMSIFLLGPFVGGGLALIFGGLIVGAVADMEFHGTLAGIPPWGLTFVFIGAPGMLIAALLLAVREPPRQFAGTVEDRRFPLRDALAFFWRERAFYGRFFGGMALVVVGLYALPIWTPAYLMRVHGGNVADVGLQYGSATLIAGSFGVLLAPWLARRLQARYPVDAPLRTAIAACIGAAPCCLFLPFAPDYWSALRASIGGSFFVNFALPMAASALQASTPNRMRGLATSIYAFVLTSIGLGVAPTLIAVVSDFALDGPTSIGTALGWCCGLTALAAIPVLAGAARRYAARLAAAEAA
ncbi:MAG: MFS transporter [Steroidobacteraceae bacterium]|nr:MFS transporter [Steroidobacteraceae bacterium]